MPISKILTLLSLDPLRFLFLKLCPQAFYPMLNLPRFGTFLLCTFSPSTIMGWTPTGLHRSSPPLGCLNLVLFLNGLPSLFWIPMGLYLFKLAHPALRRVWTALERLRQFWHPQGWGTFRQPQVMLPAPAPNQYYLIPGASHPRPFPRMLALLGPGPQELCHTGHLCPVFTTRLGHPCASTTQLVS
jgi:hypothetical protein